VPAPDLIGRALTAVKPNQKRWGDITCVKTWDGWAYLATVIDLQSRAVVGWATTHRRPPQGVVFHSDRGRQSRTPLLLVAGAGGVECVLSTHGQADTRGLATAGRSVRLQRCGW